MPTDPKIPIARPSSTVVLVRDADRAPEICLVRRHVNASFGGAYVFPGGVVDPADNVIEDKCVDVAREDIDRILDVATDGLGYYVAAIRELFEESGVLLADHTLQDDELDDTRQRLNSGVLPWNRLVADSNLKLNCSALRYFGHWITPDVMPKRYSTRFFLAAMPDEQIASHDEGELTDAVWMTADDALRAAADGVLPLHFPTRTTIRKLVAYKTADAMVAWATQCERDGVHAIHPVMPGDDRNATPQIRHIVGRAIE